MSRLLASLGVLFLAARTALGQVTLPIEQNLTYHDPPGADWATGPDPLLPQQWGYYAIGADRVAPLENWQRPVPVWVCDTGRAVHPDLLPIPAHSVYGWPPEDDFGHSCHVSGIIGAITANARGVAGAAGTWPVESMKVLLSGFGSQSSVALGMILAAADGAQVLNLSIQGPYGPEYDSAFLWLESTGCIAVIAAGNRFDAGVQWPGAHDRAICVSAIEQGQLRLAPYSSYGPEVDFCAPGSRVLSTFNYCSKFGVDPCVTYIYADGTSMAAPHVAAVVARMLTERTLTRDQVYQALVYTSVDLGPAGWDEQYGHGLVQMDAAVDLVRWDRCDWDRDGARTVMDWAAWQWLLQMDDWRADFDLDGQITADDAVLILAELGP